MLTQDTRRIHDLLARDRNWSLYALGDLTPRFFPQTTWFHSEDALALIYRGADMPILFTAGEAEGLRAVLAEVEEPALDLSVRENALPFLQDAYSVQELIPMFRMIVKKGFESERSISVPVRRLGEEDGEALQELFRDGAEKGEAPDYFQPWMLSEGVFFGVWKKDRLAAAAGTHLVAPEEDIAAVGNIYTRRDERGHGYGTAVTQAVTRELMRMGMTTIGLNVRRTNTPAIRAYLHSGFDIYCEFFEGRMQRKF